MKFSKTDCVMVVKDDGTLRLVHRPSGNIIERSGPVTDAERERALSDMSDLVEGRVQSVKNLLID